MFRMKKLWGLLGFKDSVTTIMAIAYLLGVAIIVQGILKGDMQRAIFGTLICVLCELSEIKNK